MKGYHKELKRYKILGYCIMDSITIKKQRQYVLHKIVEALFTYCVRDTNDYVEMIYINSYDSIKNNMDMNYNYYINNTGKFIFNNHRYKNIYGTQIMNVPHRVTRVIDWYVKMNGIKPNDKLLGLTLKQLRYMRSKV